MALNDKQEKFAQSYILHRNASEAARAAGYAKNSATHQGYRLLQMSEIVERIENLEQELTTDVDVVTEIENQYSYAKTNGLFICSAWPDVSHFSKVLVCYNSY